MPATMSSEQALERHATTQREASGTSWLCRDDSDRDRLIDMEGRIKRVRVMSLAVLGAALVLSAPWLGWWTLLPLLAAGAGFSVMDRGLEKAARPEYRMAAAWILSELAIAASIALTGGPKSPAVAWLAIPVVTLGARFSARGVTAGVGIAAFLMAATTFGLDPVAVARDPQLAFLPLALLGAVALLSTALMESDLHHRTVAVIDPLTSMLNRGALRARLPELAQQAIVARSPVGLIIGDVDGFKAVNDEHGHSTGDAVLRDIAYLLRKELRAFDLAYRLGGEEFLILLPGADEEIAVHAAEKLRTAVADTPVAGLSVTMSFGVSASATGGFDYDPAFEAADAALYEAKRAGRNRIRAASDAFDSAVQTPRRPAAVGV